MRECKTGILYTTFGSHKSLCCGETSLRQIGQEKRTLSHVLMHSMWKQCSHPSKHPTISFLAYFDKQIGHITSFFPGSFIFSFNSTFLYNSNITDSTLKQRSLPLAIERRISIGTLSELNMIYMT